MNNEINDFIKTGLTRYKNAHNIYWRFREETQKMLILILEKKENYGKFELDKNSYLTKSWANGLLLNVRVSMYYNSVKYSTGIGLDWNNNKNELPIPFVWIEDEKAHYIKLKNNHKWKNSLYEKNNRLGYFKNYELEDLDEIYESMLNEVIDYLNKSLI